jgi:hypothetical protein
MELLSIEKQKNWIIKNIGWEYVVVVVSFYI